MAAPAGPCEWCGGPQFWTVVRGEVWVSCKGGCSSLPGLVDELPPVEREQEQVARLVPVAGGVWWE